MKKYYHLLFMKCSIISITMFVVLSCQKNKVSGQNNTAPLPVTITYEAVTTDFPNPERGFYRYSETKASNFTPLNLTELRSYRNEQSIWSANYKVLSTLVFRYYILDGFTGQPLSNALLNSIRTDFDIARTAGVKLIPRFVYTVTATSGSCPEGFICPPYGDAPKSIVITHINQLKPIFTDHADVIACVQMGFIGTWGEQYYTDYFGDASQNQPIQKLINTNWQDRIDILQALLNAVPKDRMIQIRYPQFKQRYVYGIDANLNVAALTETEAFNETDKARIAFHNDCFLSGPNDIGTYEDYGNSSTPRSGSNTVVTALRNYKKQDSKYVAVGGETCSDDYSPQNNCATAGIAEEEMAQMHYSFLNAHYNTAVNNDWQTGGCMNSIKIKLGYRFILKTATLPKKAKTGTPVSVSFNIENIGYASPYNARPVQLLLKSKTTGSIKTFTFTTDIRRWYTGNIQLQQSFTLPADISSGEYELYLNMPDKYGSISSRPEYSIRLANKDLWDASTGYNKLNHVLIVE